MARHPSSFSGMPRTNDRIVAIVSLTSLMMVSTKVSAFRVRFCTVATCEAGRPTFLSSAVICCNTLGPLSLSPIPMISSKSMV